MQLPIPYEVNVEYFFMSLKPKDGTYQGEIPLASLESDEPLMSIKLRIAVQASEVYRRSVSAYDFVLALVRKENFAIVTLIDDELVETFKQLEWNPNTEFLIAYERNPRAMLAGYNHGLAPNYIE